MVYCHNTDWLTEVWSLGSYSTVFQVELDAIGKLAVDLCKQKITKTEVIIYCNPRAAVRSLEMALVRSKTALNTRSAVSELLIREILLPPVGSQDTMSESTKQQTN